MIALNFPEPRFKTRYHDNKPQIFDEIRLQWVALQPEEWVRQNFISWLTNINSIPSGLISIEKTISLGSLSKRFDLLIYDKLHQPWMMVECKAQGMVLAESALRQILLYNMVVPVKYIVITNGNLCYVADRIKEEWLFKFPLFPC